MKKKILIGTILAVFILMISPSISAVEVQVAISDEPDGFDHILETIERLINDLSTNKERFRLIKFVLRVILSLIWIMVKLADFILCTIPEAILGIVSSILSGIVDGLRSVEKFKIICFLLSIVVGVLNKIVVDGPSANILLSILSKILKPILFILERLIQRLKGDYNTVGS